MTQLILSISLILNVLISPLYSQSCAITSVSAVPLSCAGNYFSVSVDLEVENPSSPGFTLAGNGLIYGTYLYTDLPVTVGPLLGDDESTYEFIAWDVDDPDCQHFTTLPAANCGPICSISNFELTFLGCVSNNSALVDFTFTVQNPTGITFDLYNEEGESLGTWFYSSLPVTLPFFEVSGAAPIILTVCDHNNAACCETFVLDAIDCNPNNCEIFSVTVDPECTGNNFLVHLDFGYDNPPSDSFTVNGNSLNYGIFAYSQLPITLGPLNGSSNLHWEFHIADSQSGSCNTTYELGLYNCPPPCDMLALEAFAYECVSNEAYSLMLDLDVEGEGDLGFAVFSETYYYGSYSYNVLPLTLPAFESSNELVAVVTVCDNEHLGCCYTTLFEALDCPGCVINNLTATPLPCNAEGEIFVQIDFSYHNVSMEGFEVTGNGNNYGTFSYDDLPIQVGPFVGDGSQFFEFVVTDLADPLCFAAVELGFINCDDICELTNLVVDPGNCTGYHTYTAHIDFDFQGVAGDGFDLYLNGEIYGFFFYDDLPLIIADFPSGSSVPDTITVCDNDNELCCATFIIEAPDCECSIFDATAQILDCTSDSTFAISLEFFYENLPGSHVEVSLEGQILGFFNVEDLPLVINIPEGDGQAVLTVCANDLETCCDEVVIQLMTCEILECSISALLAEVGECTSDSTFILDIVFHAEDLPTDSVVVSANGQVIGQYQVHPDFNRIENFPVLDGDSTELTVCAVGDPECCDTYTFFTPDCSLFGQCLVWDLVAEAGQCTSDSTYTLHLNFNAQNLDSVIITANGNFILQSPFHEGNIVIEHFPLYDTSLTLLIVCAAGDSTCCDTFELETPSCDGCHLFNLVVDTGVCLTDSTYSLFIHYSSFNEPSDSVVVTSNEGIIGYFMHNPDGFTIDSFPIFPANHTFISVCFVEAPDCCDAVEFETPDCGPSACTLMELLAETGDCTSDSTFVLDVVFQSEDLPVDSVLIYANDVFVGQFFNHPDFIHLENFPLLETDETLLTVCALGAPDCCDTFSFVTPFCTDECVIYDVAVTVFDCNSDSTFAVLVQFEYQNITAGGFDIYSGNQYLGFFSFEHLPAEIGNFPANETGQYIITICESDSTVCCTSFEFAGPSGCTPMLCDIFNLEYSLSPCDEEGNFYFILDFDFQHTGNAGFNVVGNGNVYGNFSYENLPVEIGPFPTNNTLYEFLVSDGDNPGCLEFIEPGMVECLPVSTIPVDFDLYVDIFNNGTIPGIYARQQVTLTLFNLDGTSVLARIPLAADKIYELHTFPPGLYIATIMSGEYIWPVKLVKTGY